MKTSLYILLFITSLVAQEQVFYLKSGDKITGTIIEETETAYKINTTFGMVTLNKEEIQLDEVEVFLKSGDRLQGVLIKKTEYSVGLNDKLGYFGLFSKSWIQETDNKESYMVAGGLGLIGGIGYGQKYYFSKGRFSPYCSLTGLGYYVLAIGAVGSVGICGALGVDMSAIKWEKKEIILQFGIISMYDPIRGKNITIGGDNGPSFLMPSFNIKLNQRK